MYVCLSTYLTTYIPACLPTYIPICLPASLSTTRLPFILQTYVYHKLLHTLAYPTTRNRPRKLSSGHVAHAQLEAAPKTASGLKGSNFVGWHVGAFFMLNRSHMFPLEDTISGSEWFRMRNRIHALGDNKRFSH